MTDEQVLLLTPTYKLNREWAIFLATFLGGPLAGAFLMAENFKNLSQPERVKWTWGIGISVCILLICIGYIPALDRIPTPFYSVLSVALAQQFVRRYQGPAIRQHVEDGGNLYPMGRAIVAGLVGIAVVVGIIVALYFGIAQNS
jgi:choline-glycine betaine transporter